MRVQDYDLLANEIVVSAAEAPRNEQQQQQQQLLHESDDNGKIIAAIIDHAPSNPLKLSTRRYTKLVNAIAARTEDIIPICKTNDEDAVWSSSSSSSQPRDTKFFVGGHSASGMVAIQSLRHLEGFIPSGLIGLSPFKITPEMEPIMIPALFWGFSKTTCGVKVGQAADQAYAISSSQQHRVLYQLQNPTGQPSHCAFANHGCIPICPSYPNDDVNKHSWIRPAVGESIHLFLQAVLQSNTNFTRPSLDLRQVPKEIKETYLRMFINEDDPPMPPNSNEDGQQLLPPDSNIISAEEI